MHPPHPPTLESIQEEAYCPKADSSAHSQQQYNIKGTTEQMKRLRHKPILYTWHEDRLWESHYVIENVNKHTWQKPIYIKFKHISKN